MIKFYLKNKSVILNAVIMVSLLSAFAFPAYGFARSFLLGLAAGTATVLFANGLFKSKRINQQQTSVNNHD